VLGNLGMLRVINQHIAYDLIDRACAWSYMTLPRGDGAGGRSCIVRSDQANTPKNLGILIGNLRLASQSPVRASVHRAQQEQRLTIKTAAFDWSKALRCYLCRLGHFLLPSLPHRHYVFFFPSQNSTNNLFVCIHPFLTYNHP